MKKLINKVKSKIRFSEVDSMKVVWHGNYLKFLEDGREAFGKQYQLGYYDVFDQGFMTPIVKMDLNYKNALSYLDEITIETEFINTDAAKIVFDYRIFRVSDNKLVLTANSTQAFIDLEGTLQLTNPDFYIQWKKRWGLPS
ncbi:MAG: acyl-CoA thioesterase [Chloroflexia bacterium]|nr:acyl-CoA thioesterase [Chloroflexia bacterium]